MGIQHEIIMEQSRHLWIYGENGEKRASFLRTLETLYPIKANENVPMAIYMDSFVLPRVEEKVSRYDKDLLNIVARNHTEFAFAENILRRIVASKNLEFQWDEFLNKMNRLFLNRAFENIKSPEELLQALKEARKFYEHYYVALLRDDKKENINTLKIQFLEVSGFVHYVKKYLHNDAYFGFIIDHQAPFPLETTKAINLYAASRCNSDISMKVALESEKWETYYDMSGRLVEAVHDYGIIELDDSLKKYMKRKVN